MKAIIFDIDNTVIDWKDEYIFALKNVLKNLNYNLSDEEILKIDEMINEYEHHYNYLENKNFLDFINKNCNLDLPIEFMDMLIEEQGKCYEYDKDIEDTMKYLSNKYDIYAITNWFTYTQTKRLDNMKIAKYFKKIIGADENYLKPDKKTFDIILKDYKANDCISIGDTFINDILIPKELGMDVIWRTNKETNEYKTISKISDLMNIL